MRFLLPCLAICAVTAAQTPKERALVASLAHDLDRHGRIDDPSLLGYLQGVESRVAIAAGVKPSKIFVIRSTSETAFLLPNGDLYLGVHLLQRIENEAELAGVLAHELAHDPSFKASAQRSYTIPIMLPPCVLSSTVGLGMRADRRAAEQQATATAVKTLKVAGYEPEAVLNLLSKLTYENPAWTNAIVPDDLIDLRIPLESEAPPPGGYVVDSSEFREQRARLK